MDRDWPVTPPVSTAAARAAAERLACARSAASDSARNSATPSPAAASRSAKSMRLRPCGRVRFVCVIPSLSFGHSWRARQRVIEEPLQTIFKVDLRLYLVKDPVLLATSHQQPGDPAGAGMRGVGLLPGESPSAQQDATSQATDERIGGPQLRRNRRMLEAAGYPGPVPIEFVGADQRHRILVADVHRLWAVAFPSAFPQFGHAGDIQRRPFLVIFADQRS